METDVCVRMREKNEWQIKLIPMQSLSIYNENGKWHLQGIFKNINEK